jgi:hypothetical protein
MQEQSAGPKGSEEIGIDVVHRQFDGIIFLWQTPETRYLLKLIMTVLGSMIVYFGILWILITLFGTIPIFGRAAAFGNPFFLLWVLFILIVLARSYWNDRMYKLYPERNHLLKMKYWPSTKSKIYKRHLFPIIFFGSLLFGIVYFILLKNSFPYPVGLYSALGISLTFITYPVLFIMAFFAVRGIMKAFEKRYVEKFQRQRYWFFVLLPIPWILFFIFSYTVYKSWISENLTGHSTFLFAVAIGLYGLLVILGLLALLNRDRRDGYTASQISVSYVFLFVLIIPFFIGLTFDLLGPIISLLAMTFLFIQGTLDARGDDLRKYYGAWDKKLQQFHINSEEEILKHTYDRAFDTTPLDTEVPNAYRNMILSLFLLLLAGFGVLSNVGFIAVTVCLVDPIESIKLAIIAAELDLAIRSDFEQWGITLALFIYAIVIGFYNRTPAAVAHEKPS